MNAQSSSNNNVFGELTGYKDKPCIGLACNNRKTYQYHISLTICSSFLCADCKRSVESAGWITERIESQGNVDKEEQNSDRQNEIRNDDTNINRIKKDNRSSSKTLLKLQ